VNLPLVLNVVGLLFEVGGLVLAAHGYQRTWTEFRNAEDKFFQPVTQPLNVVWRRMFAAFRRVIRRPITTRTVSGSAVASGIGLAGHARGSVTWAPFPPIKEDPVKFAEIVELRLRTLHKQLEEARDKQYDDREAANARHAEALGLIDKLRTESKGHVQTIAVGGLREAAAGLASVGIGVIASGLANIMQSV